MPRSLIGVSLSFVTVILGVLTGVFVKQVSTDINLFTTIFYRFVFSLPLIFAFGFFVRGAQVMQINQRRALIFRTFFGCCGMFLWFTSLRVMPFGMATALFQSSVLFVTLLSPFLLGERVGLYRWTAVVAGLTGVIIIANPFSDEISWAVLYGVAASLAGAGLSLTLRQLGKRDEPVSVACWYNLSAFAVVCALLVLFPDQLQSLADAVLMDLVWLGIFGAGMQITVTSAYRYADAVVVASMRYLQMPLAGILGYVVFAEVMTAAEIAGAAIIILSCLVIAWRELVRARQVTNPVID